MLLAGSASFRVPAPGGDAHSHPCGAGHLPARGHGQRGRYGEHPSPSERGPRSGHRPGRPARERRRPTLRAAAAPRRGHRALVLIERRHAAPVVLLEFFTRMRGAAPLLAMMLIPAGQAGLLYFTALFTQNVLGFTPLQTGLSVLPFSAALLAANLLTGRLVPRHGERIVGSAGMSALLAGSWWMSRIDAADTFAAGLLGPFVLLGLGAGLTIAPLTAVIMHQAPPAHLGAASSLNQGMQQLGGALGLAGMTTVYGGASTGEAASIATALTTGTVFPLLALTLFATWARPTTPGGAPR
ncbi:MFS transporter [Nonomuraea thailandensis]|uniref:MFS transporter n=1 Tax=Nonomuraea thailandensis TaxID=1188745 RepID=UPI0027E295AB|nr:MFS transporter [Nonomuraea thailandensis]